MLKPKLTVIFTTGSEGGAKGELAIDDSGRLYWNTRPVITERGISLTTMQKVGAFLTVTSAALGGFLAFLQIISWFKT